MHSRRHRDFLRKTKLSILKVAQLKSKRPIQCLTKRNLQENMSIRLLRPKSRSEKSQNSNVTCFGMQVFGECTYIWCLEAIYYSVLSLFHSQSSIVQLRGKSDTNCRKRKLRNLQQSNSQNWCKTKNFVYKFSLGRVNLKNLVSKSVWVLCKKT